MGADRSRDLHHGNPWLKGITPPFVDKAHLSIKMKYLQQQRQQVQPGVCKG